LARVLGRGPSPAEFRDRIGVLKREVDKLREQRERAGAALRDERIRREKAEAKLEATAGARAAARDTVAGLVRNQPSVALMRETLPVRSAWARTRAGLEGAERERRFRDASPAYVAAVAAAPSAAVHKTTLQGLTWWTPILRDSDREAGSRWLAKQKFPYRAIAQTRELAVGGIMLDLGANIGRMSLPRVLMGDVTAVYCAEPDPLNYECLVRNVVDNGLAGLVCPDHVAIGAAPGIAKLQKARHSGAHSLIPSTTRATVDVPMLTLDGWLARLGLDARSVGFVKMDVQGWEGHVLAGAQALLAQRHVVWQLEVKPRLLRAAGTAPGDFLAALAAHFTHFIDVNKELTGPKARPTSELEEALAYLREDEAEGDQTDLLVFNLGA
jgi:FkbM family methyltransferase